MSSTEQPERPERWTTAQAAEHCRISPKTWRAYAATGRPGMPDVIGRDIDTGQNLYDADAVRDWHASRPGGGARTDRLHAELRPLAEQIAADAPAPRVIRTDRHDLPDGITIVVSWHRMETFPAYGGNQERERLDSVRAIAPGRLLAEPDAEPDHIHTTGTRHWVYRKNLRNPVLALDALAIVVGAARRDHREDQAVADYRAKVRADALADLHNRRDAVAAALADPQRLNLMNAYSMRRDAAARYRDTDHGLTVADIADACGLSTDEVERAY